MKIDIIVANCFNGGIPNQINFPSVLQVTYICIF